MSINNLMLDPFKRLLESENFETKPTPLIVELVNDVLHEKLTNEDLENLVRKNEHKQSAMHQFLESVNIQKLKLKKHGKELVLEYLQALLTLAKNQTVEDSVTEDITTLLNEIK